MKLSLYSEYALLSMIHLGRTNSAPLEEIASEYQIPIESLMEIFSVLSSARYIVRDEEKYSISKRVDKITVAEVIRIFDGVLAPIEPVSSRGYAVAPMDKEEKLVKLFEDIQEQILDQLESTKIKQLI
jgi:Rrf2 family transcriptional regulator, cysteine metabolism repressor